MEGTINEAKARIQSLADEINENVKSYVNRNDFAMLRKELKNFIHISDLINFKKEIMPVINEAQEVMKLMRDENSQMKEVIQGFDEVLCCKANKTTVNDFEQRIYDDFIRKIDIYQLE